MGRQRASWDQRLLEGMTSFMGSWLGAGQPRPVAGPTSPEATPVAPAAGKTKRTRKLKADLFLTLGSGSIRLFPTGPIDELVCFQRYGVSNHHEFEYVTRVEDAGSEDYKSYGVLRLKGKSSPLSDLGGLTGFWDRLSRAYGIETIPTAMSVVRGQVEKGYDPARGHDAEGIVRIAPPQPGRVFKKTATGRVTYEDVLEIVRVELDTLHRIAWMEGAFGAPTEARPVVHRYYLGGEKKVFLVRDQLGEPKKLYETVTCPDAVKALLSTSMHARPIRLAS